MIPLKNGCMKGTIVPVFHPTSKEAAFFSKLYLNRLENHPNAATQTEDVYQSYIHSLQSIDVLQQYSDKNPPRDPFLLKPIDLFPKQIIAKKDSVHSTDIPKLVNPHYQWESQFKKTFTQFSSRTGYSMISDCYPDAINSFGRFITYPAGELPVYKLLNLMGTRWNRV
jgi:hypothetical protein